MTRRIIEKYLEELQALGQDSPMETKEVFYSEFKHVEQGNTITFRDYEEYLSWVGDPNTNLYDWYVVRFSRKTGGE